MAQPPKDRHLDYAALNPRIARRFSSSEPSFSCDAFDRTTKGRVVDCVALVTCTAADQVRSPSDCESELLEAEGKRDMF